MREIRKEIESKIRGSIEALYKMKSVEIYHPDYADYVLARKKIVEKIMKYFETLNTLKV